MKENKKKDPFKIPLKYSKARLGEMFSQTGESQGWLSADAPLVLAVSGGSDSMAMLWLFSTFRPGSIVAAHLDHGIRGEEARGDARFVREMSEKFGVRFITRSLAVPDMLLRGESLEDGARRIRYSFLEEVRESVGGWGIGVAHTSDDAAETFIHNLLRGSGVRGLTGIQPRRGYIFRPLLNCSRLFLRDMLTCYGIPWREDSTNEDITHMRNRIRNVIIPLLEREINVSAREHILGTARDMEWFRRKEEEEGETLVKTGSVSLPWCSYACSSSFLKEMDEGTAAIFIRTAGRKLGLKTLSRDRTENLRGLFHKRGPWCFQWQRDMFVFGSLPFIAWVDPAILNKLSSREEEFCLHGKSGRFTWNGWPFIWKKIERRQAFAGWMKAVSPVCSSIKISSLSSLKSGEVPGVPDWGKDVFPVLSAGSFRWIPFWGRREQCTDGTELKEALCIASGFPRILNEKGKKNELQAFRGTDHQ